MYGDDTPPEGYPVIQPPREQPPGYAEQPPERPQGATRVRNLTVAVAALAALLVVSLVALAVIASSKSDDADRELSEAREQIEGERQQARREIAAERNALEDEKTEIEDEIESLNDDASEARQDARREEKELSRLQNQVSGVEDQLADATIPGDGTFVVGDDIQPGTYKSEGQDGCYWARLSGLGGGLDDIIANGNPTGQVTIEVGPGDKALELTGCAEFVRQGG